MTNRAVFILISIFVVIVSNTSAQDQDPLPPGLWVHLPPSLEGHASYLSASVFDHAQEYDGEVIINVQNNYHTSRVAALRNWLTTDGLISKSYSDPLIPSVGTRWFISLSSAGYAFEGHAVILIFAIEDNRITEIDGYGFWTESPDHGIDASFGPDEFVRITKPPWFVVSDDNSVLIPGPHKYETYVQADGPALEEYRMNLARHWGKLKDEDALQLLLSFRALRKTLRVTEDESTNLIEDLNNAVSQDVDLERMIAVLDFSETDSVGFASYGGIWRPLLGAACDVISDLECLAVESYYSHYPQSAFEWSVSIGPHVQIVESNEPWNIHSDLAERRLVSVLDGDMVGEPDENGVVIVDFAEGRTVWMDDRFFLAARYVGLLENGRAVGDGTLYFGKSKLVENWEMPGLGFVTAHFRDGRLDGPASFFYASGTIRMQGRFIDGVKSGPVTFFHPIGLPHSKATFLAGRVTDGPILKTDFNIWSLLPWRIFQGEIRDGIEIGEWSYVSIVSELDNEQRLVTKGNAATIHWADGSMLFGAWNHRYQTFVGPCSLLASFGQLDTNCDGRIRPSFPYDGPGVLTPAAGELAQDVQDVVVVNGQFSHYRMENVQIEDAGWLRKVGRELVRFGKDTGERIEDVLCDFGKIFADECNINIAVHIDGDGNVTIGETPRLALGPQADGEISEEAIQWLRRTESFDLPFIPLWFDASPDFETPKLSAQMPQHLDLPPFPPGHVAVPTITGLLRAPILGQPHHGARRARLGGVYHTGIDFMTVPGDPILSPVTGMVKYVVPHIHGLDTIVIESEYVTVRILYVNGSLPAGTPVLQGQPITTAGNLSVRRRYHGVPNHVHMTILEPGTDWTYSISGDQRIRMDWPYPVSIIPE